jgi:hypothetical protein
MHITAVVLAFAVAVAAGVYSTWSPCGLSMLSQLTPVAEQGRGNRFRVTATWFVVGALAGGVTLGVPVALLAAITRAVGITSTAAAGTAAVVALVCAAFDARLFRAAPPFFRRQVNEDWLGRYRGWVYGIGFGWQIGAGVTTYIMTTAVFALVVFGALSASPVLAFGAVMTFALVRGIAVFASDSCTTHDELLALHARVARSEPVVRRAVVFVLAATAVIAATVAAGWLGLAAAGACVAAGEMYARRVVRGRFATTSA